MPMGQEMMGEQLPGAMDGMFDDVQAPQEMEQMEPEVPMLPSDVDEPTHKSSVQYFNTKTVKGKKEDRDFAIRKQLKRISPEPIMDMVLNNEGSLEEEVQVLSGPEGDFTITTTTWTPKKKRGKK